jgi:hypothetical protein
MGKHNANSYMNIPPTIRTAPIVSNRFELCTNMLMRIETTVQGPNGDLVTGHILNVGLEDGSGRNLLVTMTNAKGTRTIFVRSS